MKSKIHLKDRIVNHNPNFGELNEYFPCMIDDNFALFTFNELKKSIDRGIRMYDHQIPFKHNIFKTYLIKIQQLFAAFKKNIKGVL